MSSGNDRMTALGAFLFLLTLLTFVGGNALVAFLPGNLTAKIIGLIICVISAIAQCVINKSREHYIWGVVSVLYIATLIKSLI